MVGTGETPTGDERKEPSPNPSLKGRGFCALLLYCWSLHRRLARWRRMCRRRRCCRCLKPVGRRLRTGWPTFFRWVTAGCGCRRRRGRTAGISRWATTCTIDSTWANRAMKPCTAPRPVSRRWCERAHAGGDLGEHRLHPESQRLQRLGTVDTRGHGDDGG